VNEELAVRDETLKRAAENYFKSRNVSQKAGFYEHTHLSVLIITYPRSSKAGYLIRILAELDRQLQELQVQ